MPLIAEDIVVQRLREHGEYRTAGVQCLLRR